MSIKYHSVRNIELPLSVTRSDQELFFFVYIFCNGVLANPGPPLLFLFSSCHQPPESLFMLLFQVATFLD